MVEHLSDDQLSRMRLGGHDPIKVHAAYRAAFDFDLEEEDFDFVEVDFACAPLEGFLVDCFAEVLVVFARVDEDATCFVLLLREPLPRTRIPGASLTGSATVIARPGAIVFEER